MKNILLAYVFTIAAVATQTSCSTSHASPSSTTGSNATVTGALQIDNIAPISRVLAWSWGMSQSASAQLGSGSGTGKVSVQDLSFTTYVDDATPQFIIMCATGKHFKEAKLQFGDVTVILKDGLISSVSQGGAGNDLSQGTGELTENITLNFASFEYSVNGGAPVTWNIASNSAS